MAQGQPDNASPSCICFLLTYGPSLPVTTRLVARWTCCPMISSYAFSSFTHCPWRHQRVCPSGLRSCRSTMFTRLPASSTLAPTAILQRLAALCIGTCKMKTRPRRLFRYAIHRDQMCSTAHWRQLTLSGDCSVLPLGAARPVNTRNTCNTQAQFQKDSWPVQLLPFRHPEESPLCGVHYSVCE